MSRQIMTTLILLLCGSLPAFSADKMWNRLGDGLWGDPNNWSPNGLPAPGDHAYLGASGFPAGGLTTLDINDDIGFLTVMNGSRLTTGIRQLNVNSGVTTITGAGSTIFLERRSTGDFDSLDAEGVVITNGGRMSLIDGILEIESGLLDIRSTGSLDGHGTIELVETGLAGSAALNNNGRIAVGRTLFDPLNVTLTITNFDTGGGFSGTGGIDLDGSSGGGIVDVDDGTSLASGNLTLQIQGQITDAFDGTMDIGRGDTVDMINANNPWSIGAGGTVNFNGANGVATLKGQTLTNSGQLRVNSGTARIDTPLRW